MKFVAFNVREDERRYFEEWSKENGIEVSLKKEEITPDNVSETVGYDAVIGLQTGLYPDNLFTELSDANFPCETLALTTLISMTQSKTALP